MARYENKSDAVLLFKPIYFEKILSLFHSLGNYDYYFQDLQWGRPPPPLHTHCIILDSSEAAPVFSTIIPSGSLTATITQITVTFKLLLYLISTLTEIFHQPILTSLGQLNILQINLNQCKAANDSAKQNILQNSIDTAILQDAYCSKDSTHQGFPKSWAIFPSKKNGTHLVISNIVLVYSQFFKGLSQCLF